VRLHIKTATNGRKSQNLNRESDTLMREQIRFGFITRITLDAVIGGWYFTG